MLLNEQVWALLIIMQPPATLKLIRARLSNVLASLRAPPNALYTIPEIKDVSRFRIRNNEWKFRQPAMLIAESKVGRLYGTFRFFNTQYRAADPIDLEFRRAHKTAVRNKGMERD